MLARPVNRIAGHDVLTASATTAMSGFAGEARCKRVAAQHSKGAPACGNAEEKTRPGRLTRFRDEPMTAVELGTWPGRLTRFRDEPMTTVELGMGFFMQGSSLRSCSEREKNHGDLERRVRSWLGDR